MDIGNTEDAVALVTAIAAEPDDAAVQLVLADLLLSVDDPRGELIVLDRREREQPITDAAALERYLLLAAEYTFPRARPIDRPTFSAGADGNPVMFARTRKYSVVYRRGRVELSIDGASTQTWRVNLSSRSTWTVDESTPILSLLADAIDAASPIQYLRLPFETDPLPTYEGGRLRGYALPREFWEPRGISPWRYGLAAHDYQRWRELFRRLTG